MRFTTSVISAGGRPGFPQEKSALNARRKRPSSPMDSPMDAGPQVVRGGADEPPGLVRAMPVVVEGADGDPTPGTGGRPVHIIVYSAAHGPPTRSVVPAKTWAVGSA
jgi:hypothetical protein